MPKVKSKRGAAKRFKVTASGKVKYKKANLRHIMSAKTEKQKRNLKHKGVLSKDDEQRIPAMLPYSF
jgi:large subunit ribosomal protein L35